MLSAEYELSSIYLKKTPLRILLTLNMSTSKDNHNLWVGRYQNQQMF